MTAHRKPIREEFRGALFPAPTFSLGLPAHRMRGILFPFPECMITDEADLPKHVLNALNSIQAFIDQNFKAVVRAEARSAQV